MPDPSDAADAAGDFISEEEFTRLMKTDAEFREKLMGAFTAVLAMPPTPENRELQERARRGLAAHQSHDAVLRCVAVFDEGNKLLQEAGETLDPAAMRAAIGRIEEARDHLLDMREPERSRYMAQLTQLCERMRAVLQKV